MARAPARIKLSEPGAIFCLNIFDIFLQWDTMAKILWRAECEGLNLLMGT